MFLILWNKKKHVNQLSRASLVIKVVQIEGKGRGVIATKEFLRGDFVVEYKGDLLDAASAKKREAKYTENPDFGCYMYYFNFRDKRYW